jgi:parallel beta-helix repeat protein
LEQQTIQAGINAAADGDTVLVADGIYTGNGNRDIQFYGKSIKLISENGPEYTIIDCQATAEDPHRGVYFQYYETPETMIKGFTVKHAVMFDGGGICCFHSSPTIKNCVLTGNSWVGIRCFANSSPILDSVIFTENSIQGMFVGGSSPTLIGCEFSGNQGGMYCYDSDPITLNGCKFIGNDGNNGGGIFAYHNVNLLLTDCLFEYNVATLGGAICMDPDNCSLNMTRCTFSRNYAGGGAAIRALDCDLDATDCIFSMNGNNTQVYIVYVDMADSPVPFTRCVFYGNRGICAMFSDQSPPIIDSCLFIANRSWVTVMDIIQESPPVITNCTFSNNNVEPYYGSGSTISCSQSPPTLTNCIISFTSNVQAIESWELPTLTCCNLYGNEGGDWTGNIADQLGVNGNISLDPLYCSTDSANYHLLETSPCAPENNECGVLIGALDTGCDQYLCGDADGSEGVDIDDAVYLIYYIFVSGSAPDPPEAGDSDCSGDIDIDDVVYLIAFIFSNGPEPCADCQ